MTLKRSRLWRGLLPSLSGVVCYWFIDASVEELCVVFSLFTSLYTNTQKYAESRRLAVIVDVLVYGSILHCSLA